MNLEESQALVKELERNGETIPDVDINKAIVVRRQFFSHLKEAVVTFRPNGIQFNTSCINIFTDVTHILLMIDWEKGWFIIKPCLPDDKDGQRWCSVKDGSRKTRLISGKEFAERFYKRLGWSKGRYYKACGTLARQIDTDDELIMVFELKDAEDYPMTRKARKLAGVDDAEITSEDLADLDKFEEQKELDKKERELAKAEGRETRKSRKKSRFPEAWGDSLGNEYSQHQTKIEFPHLPRTVEEAIRDGYGLFTGDEEREHHDE